MAPDRVRAGQRQYFPAGDDINEYRLVVATPTAATAEPVRRWTAEADDASAKGGKLRGS